MSFFIGRVLPSLLASLLALATAPADVSLDAGDTIVCYGNSMVERLCEHGELEAMILSHFGRGSADSDFGCEAAQYSGNDGCRVDITVESGFPLIAESLRQAADALDGWDNYDG